MEVRGGLPRFGNRQRPNEKDLRMDIIPRIDRAERRHLIQLGRKSDNIETALRFHIVAKLGLRKTSPEVADELDIARFTVVRAAHRFATEGAEGLYDNRRSNGKPKADAAFRRWVARLLERTP